MQDFGGTQYSPEMATEAQPELEPEVEEFAELDIPSDYNSKDLINYAEKFSDEKLADLAKKIKEGYENDLNSMSEFLETRKKYVELIEMHYKPKDYPWPNAANIMLPVIMTALFNFQSRSSQALLPPYNIVNVNPTSSSPDIVEKARRLQKHLNYQLTYEMEDYYDSVDTGIFLLGQDGILIRKCYWDSNLNRPVSQFVLPTDFVIDYKTRSLDDSYRYTQNVYKHPDEVIQMMDEKIYKRYDEIDKPSTVANEELPLTHNNQETYIGFRILLESHTYVDLEDDGVMVPVVVVMDKDTNKILRIVDRRNPFTFKKMNYFITCSMIPNPDSIFGYGFGRLLLGPTITMNTAINQMLDAGHLANVGGGVVKKTAQMSRGNLPVRPGEFIEIESRDDDINKTLKQFNWPGPSQQLLALVQYLDSYVTKMTTVSDLFTGAIPRSDTAASSTMAAIEQGAKAFTAIQLRIARSMRREFQLIADLNSMHLGEYIEFFPNETGNAQMKKDVIYRADYEDNDYRIMIVTDPTVISKQQHMQNAEYLGQVIATNPFLAQDPIALKISMRKRLEAINVEPYLIDTLDKVMDAAIMQQQMMLQMQQQQTAAMEQQAKAEQAKGGEHLEKAYALGRVDSQIESSQQQA